MTTLHFTKTTTASPEQLLAALTDFGPGRSEVFQNSADDYLKVHDRGADYADVTEGSSGTWERLHYDWSDPKRVVMTTTDSNAWGGKSGHTYTFTPLPDGTTRVDATVVRDGKNFKGRFFAVVFRFFGQKVLGGAFHKTIRAIEARSETQSTQTA
jgi:hypothetical protein